MWFLLQGTIIFLVMASNIHWLWTPNPYIPAGAGAEALLAWVLIQAITLSAAKRSVSVASAYPNCRIDPTIQTERISHDDRHTPSSPPHKAQTQTAPNRNLLPNLNWPVDFQKIFSSVNFAANSTQPQSRISSYRSNFALYWL